MTFSILLLYACGSKSTGSDGSLDITSKFNSTWNVNESLNKNDDGTITFEAVTWGGMAGVFSKDNIPADWSGYEAIVFEFAEPTTVETQLKVTEKVIARAKKGVSSLTCYLGGQDVTSIDQVALQAAEPGTIKVKRIYLVPSSDNWYSRTLWEGECIFGDWKAGFVIEADKFNAATAGDRLEFIYTTDVSNPFISYWQFKTAYRDTDNTLEGNDYELNDWGCAMVGQGSDNFRITLTDKDVANLKEKGLFTNGYYCCVKQVNLLHKVQGERQ